MPAMISENEKRVRAFYDATVPGHREATRGLEAPDVIYDIPAGMPVGAGYFEGLESVLEGFLGTFYAAFDVRFLPEEFIVSEDAVVVLGRITGKVRKTGLAIDVPFAHVWTVQGGYLRRLRAFTDTAVLTDSLRNEGLRA